MSDAQAFPPAVLLGLWLNAVQTPSISVTDAANAIETITGQMSVGVDGEQSDSDDSSWLELVKMVAAAKTPVAVGLPIDGDPAGVPRSVLVVLTRQSGVVAINSNLVLFKNLDNRWVLSAVENTVMHYDLSQTRRSLTDQVAISAARLAASDLVGDEAEIRLALDEFRSLHLPPHLSKRSTDALESAAKILIVAQGAKLNSQAVHSPSMDRLRLQTLEELIERGRSVLQSVVTS
jgi:hypothetical protein